MTTFDPRGHTWDSWCALMADQFAAQQLGTATEDRWREWANGLSGIGYFANSAVPDSRIYSDWQSWAESLVGIMSIEP